MVLIEHLQLNKFCILEEAKVRNDLRGLRNLV